MPAATTASGAPASHSATSATVSSSGRKIEALHDGRLGADAAITGILGLLIGQQGRIALPGLHPGGQQCGPGRPLRHNRSGGASLAARRSTQSFSAIPGLTRLKMPLNCCSAARSTNSAQSRTSRYCSRSSPAPAAARGRPAAPVSPTRPVGRWDHGGRTRHRAQNAEPLAPTGPIRGLAQHLEGP